MKNDNAHTYCQLLIFQNLIIGGGMFCVLPAYGNHALGTVIFGVIWMWTHGYTYGYMDIWILPSNPPWSGLMPQAHLLGSNKS